MKITLNKFELPTIEDERTELIEERFGMIGFAVIVKLLARIYGTGGYFCSWCNSVIGILSKKLGVDPRTVSDVVAYAVSIGFFDGDLLARKSILTSADIQAQYFRAVSRRSGVTYDPDYVIGDFYKCCRRAVPFSTQGIVDEPARVKTDVPRVKAVKSESEVIAEAVDVASNAEAEETVEKAAVAETALLGGGIDPIIEMQCRHMFAKGKTIPLAKLVEMTGASSLVCVDGIPDVTAAEVCTPEEEMAAMLNEDFGVDVSDAVDAAVEREMSDGDAPKEEKEPTDTENDGRFVRDYKKPRCDKVYGRFFNVLLDDDEYSDLMSRIPNAGDYIQRLSKRLLDKDYRCDSAYRAIIDCHAMEVARSRAAA